MNISIDIGSTWENMENSGIATTNHPTLGVYEFGRYTAGCTKTSHFADRNLL